MGKRINQLGKGTCYHGNAGIASAFAALVDKKLRPGGVLAMVLPLSASAGLSWKGFRETTRQAIHRYCNSEYRSQRNGHVLLIGHWNGGVPRHRPETVHGKRSPKRTVASLFRSIDVLKDSPVPGHWPETSLPNATLGESRMGRTAATTCVGRRINGWGSTNGPKQIRAAIYGVRFACLTTQSLRRRVPCPTPSCGCLGLAKPIKLAICRVGKLAQMGLVDRDHWETAQHLAGHSTKKPQYRDSHLSFTVEP